MQLAPYTPSLYRPDSIGRYRSYGYPGVTRTPIPGAGYRRRQLIWGEQELNLRGSAQHQRYGSGPVPLRGCDGLVGCDGLGGLGVDVGGAIDVAAALLRDPNAYLRAHGPALVTSLDTHVVGPLIGATARRSLPYLLKYIAPPIAVLYLLTGLAAYYAHAAYTRKSGGAVTANKRRRRRRK
jgi:hypothetical protein